MELDKKKGERMEKDKKTTPQDHGLRIGQKVKYIQLRKTMEGHIRQGVRTARVIDLCRHIFGVEWTHGGYKAYSPYSLLTATGTEKIEAQ